MGNFYSFCGTYFFENFRRSGDFMASFRENSWVVDVHTYGFLAVAGLPSVDDVCDVPIVSAVVAKCSSCVLLLLLTFLYCLFLAVLLLMSDDIYDVPTVPAAAVISKF
jgi:hypothetical protein